MKIFRRYKCLPLAYSLLTAIFSANKKIASKLSLRGLQLSQWSGFEAVHNINDENSPVKLKVEKNTKSLQFKRWFGKSKVVDENGEPLVVYHGTDAEFTVIDTQVEFCEQCIEFLQANRDRVTFLHSLSASPLPVQLR